MTNIGNTSATSLSNFDKSDSQIGEICQACQTLWYSDRCFLVPRLERGAFRDQARPFAKSQALLLGGDQDPSSSQTCLFDPASQWEVIYGGRSFFFLSIFAISTKLTPARRTTQRSFLQRCKVEVKRVKAQAASSRCTVSTEIVPKMLRPTQVGNVDMAIVAPACQ